jgi:very-long-chain (3R)-3-hydroxyacyl-CoA dehydratase
MLAPGIVSSSMMTTLMQVSSRFVLVWGVVYFFPFLAQSNAYSSMLIAWSVTEVIRYSFFALSIAGQPSSFLTWLRYSTFYVLYPIGILSECFLIFLAIEPAAGVHPWFPLVFQGILLIYVPGLSLLLASTPTSDLY